MNKLLTIIIPSYNMEKYLERCCSSLVVDDPALMARLEVLVVNDGSTDKTSEIGHAWEAKYPGVFRVIDKPNGHYGSCVNRGLAEAKGVFVKVLDADDYCDRANFGALVAELAKHEEGDVDLVVSESETVDETGKVTGKLPRLEDVLNGNGKERLGHHSIVYRTERIRMIGYRQTEGVAYTDTEFIITPMTVVRRYICFPKVVTYYLVGREGQSIAPENLVKCYEVLSKLLMPLVEQYRDCREKILSGGRELYLRQIHYTVRMMYWFFFRVYACRLPHTATLEDFDAKMKELAPDLAVIADNLEVKTRLFTVYPYRAYRRHGSFRCWSTFVYRAYIWVAVRLRKVGDMMVCKPIKGVVNAN